MELSLPNFKKKVQFASQNLLDTKNFVAVQQEDEDSNQSRPLYYLPKNQMTFEKSIFIPQKWSLNNFRIGRHLGRGKFGHVYLAEERQSQHIVALKVLSKKQLINQDVVNQIRREIEIHTHVKHQNILNMFGFFFDEKRIYMILEYACEGQLYHLFRKEQRFSEKKVANYIKQMIKAVAYLHSLDIMHRDIKPENILLCENDHIKLSDFGWSVHTTQGRKTFCGTIDYIGPEILNKDYDKSIDVWMLGVLTFQLCCGSAPFQSKGRAETIKKIKALDYTFPYYFSMELRDFIKRLLVPQSQRMKLDEALIHEWILINAP